jgi:PEP-CTERM motif
VFFGVTDGSVSGGSSGPGCGVAPLPNSNVSELCGACSDGILTVAASNGGLEQGYAPEALTIATATPLPGSLPLFGAGLGALGLLAWRRKRKAKGAYLSQQGRVANRKLLVIAAAITVACFGLETANASTLTLQSTSFATDEPIAVDEGGGSISGELTGAGTSFVGSDGGSINLSPLFDDVPAPFTVLPGSCPTVLASGASCDLEAAALNTTVAGTYDDVLTLDFTYTPTTGPTQIVEVTYTLDATVGTTPIPAALPLFATGLGVLGLFVWRQKRKLVAA